MFRSGPRVGFISIALRALSITLVLGILYTESASPFYSNKRLNWSLLHHREIRNREYLAP